MVGPIDIIKQRNNSRESFNSSLKFSYRIRREFLRFEQTITVVKRLVFEPFQAVNLVVSLLDLIDVEATPAVFLRVTRFALRLSVRIDLSVSIGRIPK